MSKRSRILAVGFIACALAAAFFYLRRPEPLYEGIPLSAWVRELGRSPNWERRQRAEAAIWEIGTNAMPYLVELLQQGEPAFKAGTVQWVETLSKIDLEQLLQGRRQLGAVRAIRVLGPRAEPWLPQLSVLANSTNRQKAYLGLWALANTRCEAACPILARAITNSAVSAAACHFAAALGNQGVPLVPTLLSALDATNAQVRCDAVSALRRISPQAEQMVPALTSRVSDSNQVVARFAIGALGALGQDAATARPTLLAAACSGTPLVRAAASNALLRLEWELHDGGIIRGPRTSKQLALVFTGDQFAESAQTILDVLSRHRIRASFFLTGTFLQNTNFASVVARIRYEGHLVGPHSDAHLLYCSWDNPSRTLMAWHEFRRDLLQNAEKLNPQFAATSLGGIVDTASPDTAYFLPAFEHYNRDIADWTSELGRRLINFTPGTRSAADYTAEAATNFVSTQAILDSIFAKESQDPNGLNGFLLLFHLGAGPARADKFHLRFGELVERLTAKGYQFVRIDQLLPLNL